MGQPTVSHTLLTCRDSLGRMAGASRLAGSNMAQDRPALSIGRSEAHDLLALEDRAVLDALLAFHYGNEDNLCP